MPGNEKSLSDARVPLQYPEEPKGFYSLRNKPSGSVYHLSHGQREPDGFRSLSLPEQNMTWQSKPRTKVPSAPFDGRAA
jgi:hypothetical protein